MYIYIYISVYIYLYIYTVIPKKVVQLKYILIDIYRSRDSY